MLILASHEYAWSSGEHDGARDCHCDLYDNIINRRNVIVTWHLYLPIHPMIEEIVWRYNPTLYGPPPFMTTPQWSPASRRKCADNIDLRDMTDHRTRIITAKVSSADGGWACLDFSWAKFIATASTAPMPRSCGINEVGDWMGMTVRSRIKGYVDGQGSVLTVLRLLFGVNFSCGVASPQRSHLSKHTKPCKLMKGSWEKRTSPVSDYDATNHIFCTRKMRTGGNWLKRKFSGAYNCHSRCPFLDVGWLNSLNYRHNSACQHRV